MQTTTSTLSSDTTISTFFAGVYKWMTIAMALTAVTAWKTSSSEAFITYLMAHQGLFFVLIIVQFVAVIALAGWAHRMPKMVAILIFLGYSILTGLTLSSIFLVYTTASIMKAFVATAGMYGALAIYGYSTKRDLS